MSAARDRVAVAHVDLRSQTSLLASVLCFALAATVLMRPRKRRVHWLFALFDSTVGAWYLTSFLFRVEAGALFWERLNLVWAVLLPLAAVQFFRAFLLSDSRRSSQLNRTAIVLAAAMIVAVFTPLHGSIVLGTLIFGYVFVLLGAALVILYRAGRRARSRFDRARLTYLALVGTLAAVFTLAEYLPYVGLDIPPVGTVLILVFLYVLSQSILRFRLLDLYELAGRLAVLTALSFSLAGILWVLVALDPGHFYLHSVVAAIVLLLVFDPVRAWVEQQISQIFFRERYEFERMSSDLRRQLANVLSIDDLVRCIVTAFEGSRRLTHGAVYLMDETRTGFELRGHVGPDPAQRIDLATSRPMLDRLRKDEVLVLESLEREAEERRELGEDRDAETIGEILAVMESLRASVIVALRGETESYGLMCIRDERLRDAYSPEEVQLLKGLAAQASIAVENSRQYQRMKDRDRLAALGEMAAGLAHEIRNPLGAIKASAQYLGEIGDEGPSGTSDEFLDIIVEEVDRLNRVVSSFLDYARPSAGKPEPIDTNAVVRRSMQLLAADFGGGVRLETKLAEELPRVRVDAERLRQVLINLAQNAVQAMEGRGKLEVSTAVREISGARWVEIAVSDTGPGIPQRVLQNLFVPFVTTKDRGTGLGLAISQRIVSAAGGVIDVRSAPGVGTTFAVRLPASIESEAHSSIASMVPGEGKSKSVPPIASGTSASGSSGIESGTRSPAPASDVGEERASDLASIR